MVKIALLQLRSTNDKKKNFDTVMGLLGKIEKESVKMVFLPEAFDFVGSSKKETLELSSWSFDTDDYLTRYRNWAKDNKVWMSCGGFHLKMKNVQTPERVDKIANVHLIIDEEGNIRNTYEKMHLFDVSIPDKGVVLKESSYVIPGKNLVLAKSTPVGNIGLGVCYDLRFPEFSLAYRRLGADILTFPSAFTKTTGEAHWEVLLRSRAIETQCFVVAAAQVGHHNEKRCSYGRSMVVDPWGNVVSVNEENSEGITICDLNLSALENTRLNMPVMDHRIPSILNILSGGVQGKMCFKMPSDGGFKFGPHDVSLQAAFLENEHCVAFVNKKPVVPFHALIITKRQVQRYVELTAAELQDLALLVQKVEIILESICNASSTSIAIQDGPNAGQTVKHVHVHVLPRRPQDFLENDQIYVELARHDKGNEIKWRSEKEMIKESYLIRDHIKTNFHEILKTES